MADPGRWQFSYCDFAADVFHMLHAADAAPNTADGGESSHESVSTKLVKLDFDSDMCVCEPRYNSERYGSEHGMQIENACGCAGSTSFHLPKS